MEFKIFTWANNVGLTRSQMKISEQQSLKQISRILVSDYLNLQRSFSAERYEVTRRSLDSMSIPTSRILHQRF
jgi:hypothetical protein